MTEIDCMTVKELIARWRGLRLTKEGHVKFTWEIPLDANLKELGRRKVPDKVIPPGLYFRWFKDDNRSTVALIRELVENEQLVLYKRGRRFLSNGRWLHDVESVTPAAIKELGASMLFIGRKNINDVEHQFSDHRQDDLQMQMQLAAAQEAHSQEQRQDIFSPVDVTDHDKVKEMIADALKALEGYDLKYSAKWLKDNHYEPCLAAYILRINKWELDEIGECFPKRGGKTRQAHSNRATILINSAIKKYNLSNKFD